MHMRLYWGPCYVYACISKTALACPFLFMFFWSLTISYEFTFTSFTVYCSIVCLITLYFFKSEHCTQKRLIKSVSLWFFFDCLNRGLFLHEHAGPKCAWILTTGSALIKMASLKAIIVIIFLVGLGECARDLTKCVVCKKTLTWS